MVTVAPLRAQSNDCDETYLSAINSALDKGDCEMARRYYNAYVACRGNRIDPTVERRIQECDSTKAAADRAAAEKAATDRAAAERAAAQAAADRAAAERAAAKAAAERAAADRAAADRAAADRNTSKSSSRRTSSFSDGYDESTWFLLFLGLPMQSSDETNNPVSFGVSVGSGERLGWYGSLGLGTTSSEANLHLSIGPTLRLSKGFMLTAGIGYCYDGAESPTLPHGFIYEAALMIGSDDGPMLSAGFEGVGSYHSLRLGFGWRL